MKNTTSIYIFLKNYEVVAASILAIVGVLALSIIFLFPNFLKAKIIYSQRGQLRNRLTILNKKANTLSSLDKKYYQENFSKISQVLPNSKDFVSLFTTFDLLQIKSGVIIQRTEFQLGLVTTDSATLVKQHKGGQYRVPMRLEILGQKPQIEKFLEATSDLVGRLITFDEATWNFLDDDLIVGILNGQAYFYPLVPTTTKSDSPLPELEKSNTEILTKISQNQLVAPIDESVDEMIVGKRDLFN